MKPIRAKSSTPLPTTKVANSGLAGACSLILIWVLSQVGVDMPPEVASAITTVASFLVGYLTSPNPKETTYY